MLRMGTIHDCEAVYDLICEMEGERLPFDAFSLIYREQLQDGRYACLVCERAGAVIAVLNMRFERQLHHASCVAEILEFAVGAAYRGQGLGSRMLERACQLAKEKNCVQIEVASSQFRKDAHRFYIREGMLGSHLKFSKKFR